MVSSSAHRWLLSGPDGLYLAIILLVLLLQKTYASCPAALCDCSRYSTYKTIRCDISNLTEVPLGLPADTKTLRLEHNRLTKLAAADFSNLVQLEKLYLYNNLIGAIEEGAFRGLSSLTRLDLTSNSISGITNGTFVGAPKLETLKLRNNRLSVLPHGTFSQVPLLNCLDLAANNLNEFPADVSQDLFNLKELDLSHNPITLAPSFGQLQGALEDLLLKNITVHATGQFSVPESAFDGLMNLTTLELQENYLTEIPRAVKALPNLITIILEDNFIRTVKEGDFHDPSLLQELYLESNSLVEIPTSGLSKLPQLLYLILDYNSIATIPARAFSRNTQLQELSLYSAGISSIDKDAFQSLQNLRELRLGGNNLTTIVGGVFDNINPALDVFLDGNPLLCDCKLRAFGGWLKNDTSPPQTLKCAAPERLQGTQVVDVEPEEFACKPRLLANIEPTTSATQGTDVPLTCRIEADPITDIYWITSNHSVVYPHQPKSRFYFLTGSNGTLMITDVSLTDQGSYTCVVKNSAGEMSSSVTLAVSMPSPPTLDPTSGPTHGEQGLVYSIIAGGVIIVCVVVLLLIVVCRSRRRKPGIQNNPLPPVPENDDSNSGLYDEIPGDIDANGYATRINVNQPEINPGEKPHPSDQHNTNTYLDPKCKKNNNFHEEEVFVKRDKVHHVVDLQNDSPRYFTTPKPSSPTSDQLHTYLDPQSKNNNFQEEDVSSRWDKGKCVVDHSKESSRYSTTEPSTQSDYMSMKPLPHLGSG